MIKTRISTEVSCGCAELLEISDLLSGISITAGLMISGWDSTTGSGSSSENLFFMQVMHIGQSTCIVILNYTKEKNLIKRLHSVLHAYYINQVFPL